MDVLIVEDERLISLLLSSMVNEFGHRVIACLPSGESALDFLKNATPDLILMDIRLEGELDGIETAACIEGERTIPLAFASAYMDAETRVRAETTRPLAVLRKPVRKEDIGALLRLVGRGASA